MRWVMEPTKDIDKVKRMFSQGQIILADPSTGYKYSMAACCPKDGSFSSIAQLEKSGESISRLIFKCPNCSHLFEAKQEEIYIW
jgi:hypothetical protein